MLKTTDVLTRPPRLPPPVREAGPEFADELDDSWAGEDAEWLADDYDPTRFLVTGRAFVVLTLVSLLVWGAIGYALFAI